MAPNHPFINAKIQQWKPLGIKFSMKSEEKTSFKGLLRAVFRESTTKRLFETKYPDMYKHLSNVVEEGKI